MQQALQEDKAFYAVHGALNRTYKMNALSEFGNARHLLSFTNFI
jgi:hypothetical protein